jgi:hypothetical protein
LSGYHVRNELRLRLHAATLDELLEPIKPELTKLAPILDLEVAREPQALRTGAA